MPVANLLQRTGIHARPALAGIEHRHQGNEEHHVSGQGAEDKCPRPVEELPRSSMVISPVVVAASAPTPRGPAVNGRLAAGTRRLSFRFRGGGRKDQRHNSSPSVTMRLLLLRLGRTLKCKRWAARILPSESQGAPLRQPAHWGPRPVTILTNRLCRRRPRESSG